jgi:hypothetical protein
MSRIVVRSRPGFDASSVTDAKNGLTGSYAGPEVLVLYLKRPLSEVLGVETLWRGASDTAT